MWFSESRRKQLPIRTPVNGHQHNSQGQFHLGYNGKAESGCPNILKLVLGIEVISTWAEASVFSVCNALNQKRYQQTMCDEAQEGSVTGNGLLPALVWKALNAAVSIANKSQPTSGTGQENKVSSVLLILKLGKEIAAEVKKQLVRKMI